MSFEALKKKQAEAFGRLTDNEEQTTVGVSNVHPNPEGRQPGTLSAKWGDNPTGPIQHGTGVKREAKEDRQELLDRIFDGLSEAKSQAQGEMGQLLEAFGGNSESHSPLLMKSAAPASLTQRVRKLVG